MALSTLGVHGCGLDLRTCDDLPLETLMEAPQLLSQTGLYLDVGNEVLADGVRIYEPRFPLWSDGASKQRFVWLPPDATIDTSDMNAWVFPVGTKLWKDFARDGIRVETRMLHKRGPEDWQAMTYVWREDASDAEAVFEGADDERRTAHDVPAVKDCVACHGGSEDFVLGFSAIQLGHPDAGFGIEALAAEGRLTDVPTPESLEVPGDATAVAALGYLHANCGHCHNDFRRGDGSATCYSPAEPELELKLSVGELDDVQSTATYRTAVNERGQPFDNAYRFIRPGKPSKSLIHKRMGRRDDDQMPPLGTEEVDAEGLAAVDAWIETL